MGKLGEHIRSDNWKTEKHVPVIECPDQVKAGEVFRASVTVGKDVAHPNTTEHHIRWISLYYYPEGAKFNYEVSHFEFNAHGESVDGPNMGPVYTHHEAVASLKLTKSGTLHAMSYCNIHGLWEFSKEIKVI